MESGWQTLESEFLKFFDKAKSTTDHDDIFDRLKEAVVNEAMIRHTWESKASEMLRIIQLNTLEDRTIGDKRDWDAAVKFLEKSIKEKLQQTEVIMKELIGPSTKEQWLYWKYRNDTQSRRNFVKSEIDKILYSNEVFFHF